MRMHADVEESRQKLQANRKRQIKPSMSSRLGDRVVVEEVDLEAEEDDDDDDHIEIVGEVFNTLPVGQELSRRSVKERLGVRREPVFPRCKKTNQIFCLFDSFTCSRFKITLFFILLSIVQGGEEMEACDPNALDADDLDEEYLQSLIRDDE